MRIKRWATAHPIACYLALTLMWSWGIWSLLWGVIDPGGMTDSPPPAALVIAVAGGLGPSLAGVALTAYLDGRRGLGGLGARLRDWRAGWWWLALLLIPLTTAAQPALRLGLGYPVDPAAMGALLVPGLILGLSAGLMEELGWRGFLLPHMLRRRSPLAAALLVGAIWGGLWHGYADYFGLGDRGWAAWPLIILLGPGLLSAWSLVLTRIYQRTRASLLVSILMHASISSSALIFGQRYASAGDELAWTALGVGLAWLVSAGFWWATRPAAAPTPPMLWAPRGRRS
jgi:uncharacterized protein